MTDHNITSSTRPITDADLAACRRGLTLDRRSDERLGELLHRHENQGWFASRVIAAAVRAEMARRRGE